MMLIKLASAEHLKMIVFWRNGYNFMFFVHEVTDKFIA